MYIHFTFEDGSNPYISTTNKKLFEMMNKYYMEQTGAKSFHVVNESYLFKWATTLSVYKQKQAKLRWFAVRWQNSFCEFNYSMDDLCGWQDFFTEYGKKYGLLREFKENGII